MFIYIEIHGQIMTTPIINKTEALDAVQHLLGQINPELLDKGMKRKRKMMIECKSLEGLEALYDAFHPLSFADYLTIMENQEYLQGKFSSNKPRTVKNSANQAVIFGISYLSGVLNLSRNVLESSIYSINVLNIVLSTIRDLVFETTNYEEAAYL